MIFMQDDAIGGSESKKADKLASTLRPLLTPSASTQEFLFDDLHCKALPPGQPFNHFQCKALFPGKVFAAGATLETLAILGIQTTCKYLLASNCGPLL